MFFQDTPFLIERLKVCFLIGSFSVLDMYLKIALQSGECDIVSFSQRSVKDSCIQFAAKLLPQQMERLRCVFVQRMLAHHLLR